MNDDQNYTIYYTSATHTYSTFYCIPVTSTIRKAPVISQFDHNDPHNKGNRWD